MSPKWHVKDPGHSAKSAGGRLHPNTHTPLIQRSRSGLTMTPSRHSVGNCGKQLKRSLSGNIRRQSSKLAEPLWNYPGIKSGISVRELISTLKKKKRRWGMDGLTFSQNPCKRGKSHHHHHHHRRAKVTRRACVHVCVCVCVYVEGEEFTCTRPILRVA